MIHHVRSTTHIGPETHFLPQHNMVGRIQRVYLRRNKNKHWLVRKLIRQELGRVQKISAVD